jgi:low affinity Fe/Cu permease
MSWLFENELLIVFVGVAVILALGAAWSASGRKELLYAAAAAFVLLIGALIVERMVVTDAEAIRATLAEIARDVKNNDPVTLKKHIHPTATALRQKADAELPRYKFTECRVTKIHLIDVDNLAEPRSAVVEFNIVVSGTFQYEGLTADGTYPRWVKLHLLRDNENRWKVADYEHDDPQRMIMNRP